MSKVPKSLPVKITVTDISLEVPKSFFENSALKAAVFVGRKGKGSTSRHTKYFTVTDPEGLPTRTRPVVTLSGPAGADPASTDDKVVAQEKETDVVIMKFGDLNNVVYDLDLKPLSKYDGQWVFDEVGNPFLIFTRIIQVNRKGAFAAGAKSEMESNTQEMMQMDQEDSEEGQSNHDFSGSEQAQSDSEEELDQADLANNTNLTAEQIAAMNVDDRDENEVLAEKLVSEQGAEFKRRYLEFPKMIDVSDIVNTKAKTMTFSERVKCKNASLLGTVINFTLTATLPEDQVNEYEEKQKLKEAKEERKRREEEEKILAKERKKAEKEDAKRVKKGDVKGDQYGVDVYAEQQPAGGSKATDNAPPADPHASAPSADAADKKKKGFSPFGAVKGIFSKEQKHQNTPFPLKCINTPYPFLFILDKFTLRKLQLPHELYRGVHIRLGCDAVSLDSFPLLLLDTTKASALKTEELPGYGEGPVTRYSFDFGKSHIYFGDKHIRNVCGFDTLRALQELEKSHNHTAAGDESGASDTASGTGTRSRSNSELFQREILDVGEKFNPVRFEALKKVANDCMAKPTKYTRVSATLIVPSTIRGTTPKTEDQLRREFVKKMADEQKQREREAKKAEKAEKAARKAAKKGVDPLAEGSSDDEKDDDWTCSSPDSSDDDKVESVPSPASEDDDDAAKAGEGAFESHGEADVQEGPAFTATPQSRIVKNKSRSFQISTRLLNEEYTPKEGVLYSIRFATGEEVAFRARKVYLPAVASMGPKSSIYDTPLPQFKPNA